MFSGKTLLITGGTGSFGTAVLNRFLATDIGELRVFSRDKEKQDAMRHAFQANMPEVADKIKFFIGDVRDPASLKSAMHGVDFVFHAAALKGIPACESSPVDAIEINALGTDHVLTAAVEAGVQAVICLSTDKAVYPASAMGISKAMMEKIVLAKSREISPNRTKFCCTRYGNVLCSKGSVIPLWIEQMKSGKPITITEPNMTRFIMSLDEAVDLVLFAFENGTSGDILVQKAPACTIGVLAQAVKELFHCTDEIQVIGAREGEKQYETLLSQDECDRATDMGGFYRVSRDKQMPETKGTIAEFHSNNAVQLTVEQVKKKLLTLPYIQAELGARTER
ncbi:MAG: polysaccharide biosynthesis protein [Oscillospiraceae bacterium]